MTGMVGGVVRALVASGWRLLEHLLLKLQTPTQDQAAHVPRPRSETKGSHAHTSSPCAHRLKESFLGPAAPSTSCLISAKSTDTT